MLINLYLGCATKFTFTRYREGNLNEHRACTVNESRRKIEGHIELSPIQSCLVPIQLASKGL